MADYKLISADSHVNEVSATWERVRRKYGDRAPEIVWNPSEHEHGPYLSIRDWETSLEGKNRESCAMEFVGFSPRGLFPSRESISKNRVRVRFNCKTISGARSPYFRLPAPRSQRLR